MVARRKTPRPFFRPRGSARRPGADPTRLPIGLDLRAISIVEGVRAGLAAAVPVALAEWFGLPILSLAALGALMTCLCDAGGPMRRRLPLLLAFIAGGAALLCGFPLLRSAGIAPTLAAAAPVLFALSFLRVWGAPAQALGNLLAVVLLLGSDDPRDLAAATSQAGVFAAGGLWALLLTLAIWRIHPYGPARRAVADVWIELARFTRMLQRLVWPHAASLPAQARDWDVPARSGRGAVRDAIERARAILMDTLQTRGPSSGPAAQNLLRLEAADQLFGALIALSDLLEENREPHALAYTMLKRLRALLTVMATATERETLDRLPRLEKSIASVVADAQASPALQPIARVIAERLLVATKFVDPAQYLPGSGQQGEAGISWRERLAGPARANFSWRSVSLRHAARSTLVVIPALGATLIWHGPYSHWLTITLVLVMQPFFATTWQRSLERIGGTLLGGVIAAGLSTLLRSRLHLAGALPVLGALALAVRQVNYGVYIAVYTPVVILLVEQIRPGQNQAHIALARAGFTVLGGLIAVAANIVLWPGWEPEVGRHLNAAIAAHAAYAAQVLKPAATAEIERARRNAGLSSNNLEASLARAMQEPRRGQRDRLQAVLVADATLRRIGGRLTALAVERPRAGRAVQSWIIQALSALAAGQDLPPRPTETDEQLDRLARQIEVLAATLARQESGKEKAWGEGFPPNPSTT